MPAPEYILALDYGEKRVGVAIAHEVARLPRPLTTLPNNDKLETAIVDMIRQEAVKLVVVGLPRGMDGGYTEQTRIAEAFGQRLQTALSVPVVFADETLTSVDAEAAPGSNHAAGVDAVAAGYILERYLHEQAVQGDKHED